MSIPSSHASSGNNAPFALHPRLESDCAFVCDLGLCRVLLMNDSRFPWLVLVPRRHHVRELFDLNADDYRTAMEEVRHCAGRFAQLTGAHKMNVAALGNMVPQLHIHVIARFEQDAAWPSPVWGSPPPPHPYDMPSLDRQVGAIRQALS